MKLHYKIVSENLEEGTDVTAECGLLIPKAAWAFMLELDALVFGVITTGNSVRDCRKCVAALIEANQGKRYIYAVVPGEESKHEEVA